MNKDLTVGEPQSVLWKFCLPLFASVFFQQLYTIADSLIVGKYVGENALAAVGNSYEITVVFLAFTFGCSMGCSILVAQYFVVKDFQNVKTAISTVIIVSFCLCLLLMIGGILGANNILNWMHTPSDIINDSSLYLHVYVVGLPFLFAYQIANGIFTAFGETRIPFLLLVAFSGLNIALDLLLVGAFHLGVVGVALSTFFCQTISSFHAVLLIRRRMKEMKTIDFALFDKVLCKKFAAIAVPSILQQGFVSLGNVMIQSVVNGFGASAMAGYAAGVKLNNLVITSFAALGNGISTFTSQNFGAGKLARVREGMKAGIRVVWMICLPIVIIYFWGGSLVLRLFLEYQRGEAMEVGISYLKILSPFYVVVSVKLVADGILRGAERMSQFVFSTCADLAFRVGLTYLFAKSALGIAGIWYAWPMGWILGTMISIYFYKKGPWHAVALES